MDIGRYINSKDIRDYLNNIGYCFNSLEAAWLIFQCKSISMKERHEAWEELMSALPDSEIPGTERYIGGSLFKYLKRIIKIEEDTLKAFYERKDGCIFFHSGQYKEEDGENAECFDFIAFSSVEKSIDSLLAYYGPLDYEEITITKQYIDGGGEYTLTLGKNREVYSVSEELDEESERLLKHGPFASVPEFPLPFKRGDIVYNPRGLNHMEQEPIVYIGQIRDSLDSEITKGKTFVGYRVEYDKKINESIIDNPMNTEYYTLPLSGKNKTLLSISSYLKGEIDLAEYSNEITG